MHGNHQRRLQRREHLDHAFEIKRQVAIDRHHYRVDAADIVELLLIERVMQMPEMGDTHICHLENEDRIAVPLGAAVPGADVGRHIAHAHVAHGDVVSRRLVGARPPAAQDVRNARIGIVGVVRVMGVVHGGDVGQHRYPDIIVVVGGDAHELRTLDQKRRVASIGDANLVGIEREPQRGRHHARRIGRDQARAVLPHFRFGISRCLRARMLHCRQRDNGHQRRQRQLRQIGQTGHARNPPLSRCECDTIWRRGPPARPIARLRNDEAQKSPACAGRDTLRMARLAQRGNAAARGHHDPASILAADRVDAADPRHHVAGLDLDHTEAALNHRHAAVDLDHAPARNARRR